MTIIFTPAERKLQSALATRGFTAWLVGGACRDSMLGLEPKDKDFATDATPDEQIAIYQDAGIRFAPTGLSHGTLTAVIDNEVFEVTTLRTERDHDGRHATVDFTRNINDDLGRRDLTINAMAMTFDGEIIDPFNGQNDLRNRIIRFVGSPDDRMKEDYLRILRWVRFHQRFANGVGYDPETIRAIERNVAGLKNISVERVWAELSKALTYDRADVMMDMLNDTGIAHHIGMPHGHTASLYMLGTRTRNPVSRLVAYYRGCNKAFNRLMDNWKWSGEERKLAASLRDLTNRVLDEETQRNLVALHGYSAAHVAEAARLLNVPSAIEEWEVPVFPVSGNDLIAIGMKAGPQMGQTIKRLKQAWSESGFTATKQELMMEA